jgi:glutamyl-tRNA reductase
VPVRSWSSNVDVHQGVGPRSQDQAEHGKAIVEHESFQKRPLDVLLTIVSLRNRLEAIRTQELQKAMRHLDDLTPAQREAIAWMTAGMLSNILQKPARELMRLAIDGDGHLYCSILRRLFGLDEHLGTDPSAVLSSRATCT